MAGRALAPRGSAAAPEADDAAAMNKSRWWNADNINEMSPIEWRE